MKKLIIILAVLTQFTTHAKFAMAFPSYQIISDTQSNDLLSGQVRVKGLVTSTINPLGMPEVLVSTIDGKFQTFTDSLGNFDMIIHDSDTGLYVYSNGYVEIAISRYDFKAGHTVEINFYLRDLIIEQENPIPIIAYKPVIYMYSNRLIDVSVGLNVRGHLTFTYPEIGQGWNVTAGQNGIVNKVDNQKLPYLFWEGALEPLKPIRTNDQLNGWVIHSDSLIRFMEKQLSLLGLNRTEQTDFITFWCPKMMNYRYLFIQFLVDKDYTNQIAELLIQPKPDSLRRIFMLFTGFQERPAFETIPQSFEKYERKGFSVLEWGGTELKNEIK